MIANKLIQQRFSELLEKASAVQKTYHSPFGDDKKYYHVDSEIFREWGTSVLGLLQRVFGEDSPHYRNFGVEYRQFHGFSEDFENCRGILKAAKEDYDGGYLFNIRGLIKAEDSTDILEQAEVLLNGGYKDPACVVAGVALEIALKELCNRNSIPLAKLDAMNIELCKKGIYNMGVQKQVTAWAHWRNKAAHGEWSEYSSEDVNDMIKGVTRFVGQYL
jgi:hypothetical protein